MNPLNAVFRLSLRVLMKSRRTTVFAIFCCLPLLLSASGTLLILSRQGPTGLTAFGLMSYIMVYFYVYVLAIVVTLFYATALISDEYEDKTITYLFMRPVPKSTLYLGKYLAYLVTAAILLLPSAAICFLIAMAADPPGEAAGHAVILLKDLGVLGMMILSYGALYALLGAAFKRPVLVGLGFSIVWETFVTFIPGYLSKLTLKHYVLALLPHPAGERGVLGFFESPTGPATAIVVLLLATGGLLALGAWTFTNKEYVLEQ